jgi:hypothetical protein
VLPRPPLTEAYSGVTWERIGDSCGVCSAGDTLGSYSAEAVGTPGSGGKTKRTSLFMDVMICSVQR